MIMPQDKEMKMMVHRIKDFACAHIIICKFYYFKKLTLNFFHKCYIYSILIEITKIKILNLSRVAFIYLKF